MTSLKDEVKQVSGKHRVLIYEDNLGLLNGDNLEDELDRALDLSREAFLLSSSRLSDLGLMIIDDPNFKVTGEIEAEPRDAANGRRLVSISISNRLFLKIQERRGHQPIADFLDTAIGHRDELEHLTNRYLKVGCCASSKEPRRSNCDEEEEEGDEEEDEEDDEERTAEDEPLAVSILGNEYDFDFLSKVLWTLGILLFGVGDSITTYISLSAGNVETNPIFSYLISLNPYIMFTLKIVIICVLYVIFATLKDKSGRQAYLLWIPTITALIGAYLTLNNLMVIYK